jgi:glycogenin glucosyltransferase
MEVQKIILAKTFMSVLTTDDYLPGLLVLNKSLQSVRSAYPLHALITSKVSNRTKRALEKVGIGYSVIGEIHNPTDVNRQHRWFPTYSKLAIFGQVQYQKIVYLDVDMLVLRNIDNLFSCPHMAATNAGGMLPRKSLWTHLNSGLFILEPAQALFEDMVSKIGKIEKLESGGDAGRPAYGSDQDFLNAYYPDWPQQAHLHLDHAYNIFHYYADEYHELLGYTLEEGPKAIKVLHYASYLKPWAMGGGYLAELGKDLNKSLELKAIELWKKVYETLEK